MTRGERGRLAPQMTYMKKSWIKYQKLTSLNGVRAYFCRLAFYAGWRAAIRWREEMIDWR